MANTAANIVIKRGLTYYRFLYVGLSLTDGSLYLSLKKQNGEGIDVSYHATGTIHYKSPLDRCLFAEPTSRVTSVFKFLLLSIPAIERLDTLEATSDEDGVLEMPEDLVGRVQFGFTISPHGTGADPAVAVDFWPLFRLSVFVTYPAPPVPPECRDRLVCEAPTVGLSDRILMDEAEALCRFQQNWHSHPSSLILYPPNQEGVWRMVTPVPMRIPPRVTLRFEDPTLQVEEKRSAKNPNADIRFKVKGKGGFIKHCVPIRSIQLDAEF
jgi:hypothetical protein